MPIWRSKTKLLEEQIVDAEQLWQQRQRFQWKPREGLTMGAQEPIVGEWRIPPRDMSKYEEGRQWWEPEELMPWIGLGAIGGALPTAAVAFGAAGKLPPVARPLAKIALSAIYPEKPLGAGLKFLAGQAGKGIAQLLPKRPLELPTKLPHTDLNLPLDAARKQTRQYVKELVGYVDKFVGKAKPPPQYVAKETLQKGVFERMRDKWLNFVNRTFIVESKLRWLDGMEDNGVMWRTFYGSVNKARDAELGLKAFTMQGFNDLVKQTGINTANLFKKSAISTGKVFTSAERIGIYLNSLQKDNLRHMVSKLGNNITGAEVVDVVLSLTPEEKVLGQWLKENYGRQYLAMAQVYKTVTGKILKKIEGDYIPIMIEWRADPAISGERILALADKMQFIQKWASSHIAKGFTRPRTTRAAQPIVLDAIEVFLRDLNLKSHYQAFAPVVRDLQSIMQHPGFKQGLTRKAGRYTWDVLDEWLKQVADVNPLRVEKHFERLAAGMRRNAVTAVLGFNIPVSFKQLPSWIAALPEMGTLNGIKGLFRYAEHPVETTNLIKKYSPQIANRFVKGFEREMAEIPALKSAEKQITGRWAIRETFMALVKAMDRVAVSAIWRGTFDANAGKIGPWASAQRAEAIIRRTQPFFDIKDLPEYWRGGELAKWFTVFTNQLNRYWNYYRFDIAGKYAVGKINELQALERIMDTFVIPAFTIGAIARSRIPDDPIEVVKDFASMGLSTLPIFGRFMATTMTQAGMDASDLLGTEVLDSINSLANRMRKGDWVKTGMGVIEAGGYIAGYPATQARRIIDAMIKMAEDNLDDWMEIIWGEFARQKATEESEGLRKPIPTRKPL